MYVPQNVIEYAKEVASLSCMKQKMSSVVFKNSTILDADCNRWMTSSQDRLVCLYGVPVWSRHCEIGAIRRVYKHFGSKGLEGSSIYVHRIGKNNESMFAKPCPKCMQVIEMMGILYVYWSETDNTIGRICLRR